MKAMYRAGLTALEGRTPLKYRRPRLRPAASELMAGLAQARMEDTSEAS
jgi:hypothetical protein